MHAEIYGVEREHNSKYFQSIQKQGRLKSMLDVVDRKNTLRFINMVEEMSKSVQFIFITHNKVSMERSDYLMGVTMQEAGVSRMVSVDVSQALQLADS